MSDRGDLFEAVEMALDCGCPCETCEQALGAAWESRRPACPTPGAYMRRKIMDEMAHPVALAQLVRDKAESLDDRGMTSEANVLRDAATLLETEVAEC